jgi:hypothetical protein
MPRSLSALVLLGWCLPSDGGSVWARRTRREPFHTATLVLSVDHLLPPGVYRARARSGVAVSSFTEPFTVAAWGTPTGGVQVALSAAPVLKREDGLLVRITLRNAHNRALLVPSGISPPGGATPWFEFVFFDLLTRR